MIQRFGIGILREAKLLTHGFPAMKHQWEWKHPGLVNSSGQCRNSWERILCFLVLGEQDWWEMILLSVFLSFKTSQPPCSCLLDPILFFQLTRHPWGLFLPLHLSYLLHYWFLPKHSRVHSPYISSTETSENLCATCPLPGSRWTMGNKPSCLYKS